jgi:hypothetical protein
MLEESSTYQLIMERGERKALLRIILEHGRLKFGEPEAGHLSILQGIEDIEQLIETFCRIHTVGTWKELLDCPRLDNIPPESFA